MKLSTAINKADKIYVVLATAGMTIPVQISKSKAIDAMDNEDWLEGEDFEGNGEFTDSEDMSIAWYDEETKQLHLGN